MDRLLSDLNDSQKKAVTHGEGPLLVLAGAGAGKTRVITYRIAYLIERAGIRPENVLAVTFTNKAAGEMKSRLYHLVGQPARHVWMGTFHSIGLQILRRYGAKTVAGPSFSVLDQDDRLKIIKETVKTAGIDSKKHSPKNYLKLISDYKNTINYVKNNPPPELAHKFSLVFDIYEQEIRSQRLVDFDDMLSLSLRLLNECPDILREYRDMFKYILVDEFQDTNIVQFVFLQELAGENGNICVVGDDDQSIYSWRGADLENILYFDRYFKDAVEIKLVDNYRSAPEILGKANLLIGNNTARRGKDLISKSEREGNVFARRHVDERYEAEFVADEIERQISMGVPLSEIAVLYRTNAQSRNFEVALNRRQVPYKVVGGVGFYQRREIKDVLAYLRFYDNPFDESAFTRAAKTPPKGIGDSLIAKVCSLSVSEHIDLITALEITIPTLRGRQMAGLSILRNILHGLLEHNKVSGMINYIIEETGYKEYLLQIEDAEEAKSRIDNVFELYNAAISFEELMPEGALSDFLASATLTTSSDENIRDSVRLMSLHGAKGLEFESVFITGLEDGIFPLVTEDEEGELEEERRLCYVGITRAKVNLALTYVTSRLMHGKRQNMKKSRFLDELHMFPAVQELKTNPHYPTEAGEIYRGRLVRHEVFGDGVVMQISGAGDSAKVDVMFKRGGMKKLVARFLEVI